MSDYIPPELLIEIFIRLPVKSLVCFTSVCKSWYALITNPEFINMHANHTNSCQRDESFLIRYFDDNEEKYTFRRDNETFSEQLAQFKSKTPYSGCSVIGSCGGLVCLEFSGSIFLWNPSIRKSVTICVSQLKNFVLGFGVCNVTNDHKVVKLVYDPHYPHPHFPKTIPQVEVYSLSTGSWRGVSTSTAPSNHLSSYGTHCFVFDSVHWIVSGENEKQGKCNLVVSFDMGKEVFYKLMLPDSLANVHMPLLSITRHGDSLAALEYSNWEGSYCFWVMKEYGVSESWTKLFTLTIPGRWMRTLVFRKDGQVILPLSNNKLFSCDPESDEIKDLDVSDRRPFYISTYRESLVLLKGHSSITEGIPNLFFSG